MVGLLSRFVRFAALTACLAGMGAGAQQPMFRDPILEPAPDPWVIFHDGFYYFMDTTARNLTIWKTRDITDLRDAVKRVVWTPPGRGPYSRDLWAPQLHLLGGKWYIYFAADAGANRDHRIYVVENTTADPMSDHWVMKGKVADPLDRWAIDPTILMKDGVNYLLWSGWEGYDDGVQSIYIAKLRNPWTVEGSRVRLSTPQYAWEKAGDLNPWGPVLAIPHIDVNEAPQILKHGSRIFLIYSGSACWTNYYELGMLTMDATADPMKPGSWTKSAQPVFWQNPQAGAYGTGHNGFFESPDGRQSWIIYDANERPNVGCGDTRSARIQAFRWTFDGYPDFGRPVGVGQWLPKPSGTR